MGQVALEVGGVVTPCMEDGDRWFPEGYLGKQDQPGDSGPPDYYSEDAMAARALCAGCSFLQECLEGAIERQEPYGIFGGLDPDERAIEEVKRALHPVQ